MLFLLYHITTNTPITGTINVSGIPIPIPYYYYSPEFQQSPLTIVIGDLTGSSLDICLNGLGPDKIAQNLSLINSTKAITGKTGLLCFDPPLIGFSQGQGIDPQTTYYDRGIITSKIISSWLDNTQVGKKYNQFYLLLPGSMIRIVSGLYDIGNKIAGVFSVSPWFEIYTQLKFYGVGGVALGIFGSAQKYALQTTASNCLRQIKSGNFTRAHQIYQQSLQFVSSKTSSTNLFEIFRKYNFTPYSSRTAAFVSTSAGHEYLGIASQVDFQAKSNQYISSLYEDSGRNATTNITYFFKDFLQTKLFFINGQKDFIGYSQALKYWISQQFDFVDKKQWVTSPFIPLTIDGKIIGTSKSAKQLVYASVTQWGAYSYGSHSQQFNLLLRRLIDNDIATY